MHKEKIIPLYSELYSHKPDGFESENDRLLKAVDIARPIRRKESYAVTIDKQGYKEELTVRLGKKRLKIVDASKIAA